jgi:hypothetical protein
LTEFAVFEPEPERDQVLPELVVVVAVREQLPPEQPRLKVRLKP